MKIAWLVGAVGLAWVSGCGAPASDVHAASASTVTAGADRNAGSTMMKPTCRNEKPIGGHCGLIVKRVEMEDFRASFHDKKCAKLSDDACQELFESSIEGWLHERYKFANFEQVDQTCETTPARCAEPKDREVLLQQSYNAAMIQVASAAGAPSNDERETNLDQGNGDQWLLDDIVVNPGTPVIIVRRTIIYPAIKGGYHHR